jgi:tetratricopeptide (TPR) repeat protein
MKCCLGLLLLAAPLAAQTYLVAGDSRLTLAQLLHDHPEGLVLTLPSATGQSLSAAFTALLDKEPALELQLGTQEAALKQPLGRELAALRGWDAEKPHWALLGPDRQVLAEGTEAPTPERFADLYHRSPLRTRAERLRDFLKVNPDHAEALALLVLELRTLGERRAEKLSAPAKPEGGGGSVAVPAGAPNPAPGLPSTEQAPGRTKPEPRATPDPPSAARSEEQAPIKIKPESSQAPVPENQGGPKPTDALLTDEDDARIWGEYAERYEQFMRGQLWPGPLPSPSSPLPLAAQLSSFAERSPRLRDLARRLLPEVETRLRARLSDERRWKVWLSLRQAGAGGRPSELLAGAAPPPGTRHWPPSAATDAFVEDAQERDDWRDAEAVLQAAYDRNQDLLRALDAAAKEDAQGKAPVQLGSYFGFGTWNGETALLAEAKLHLGKLQEADRIFREAFARAPRPEIAREAADLARRCGATTLAEQWEALAP